MLRSSIGTGSRRTSVFMLTSLLVMVAGLSLTSCDERFVYMEYPVEFDDPFGANLIVGDPDIIPGTNHEQLFEEIQDGDDCDIIHGFQGGIWVHLSIRVTGLPSSGTIFASLGPTVGEVEYDLKLMRTAEGFLEAYDIPIPIVVDEELVDTLYGEEATLIVKFTTEQGEVTAERKVVLGEG